MKQQLYSYSDDFVLESGEKLTGLTIQYHTDGHYDPFNSKVVWICHALTANSNAYEWWTDLVGEGKLYDPAKYFIVCANVIGSCYGSTGPISLNPLTGRPYYRSFPTITVRDMVRAHDLLRQQLEISRIHTVIGGSLGGQQAMEWTIMKPDLFKHSILIATNSYQKPWAIAFNESQRMAIEADHTFGQPTVDGGKEGLRAARSIALLSYRNGNTYNHTQRERDITKTDGYLASSYQQYQGKKFIDRFDAYSYFSLTKSIDTHHIGRQRGGIQNALRSIKARTLVVSIDTDMLYPPKEQRTIAKHIVNSVYRTIRSVYGHDGFLIESAQLTSIINEFYRNTNEE